jgi:hypothetical protein
MSCTRKKNNNDGVLLIPARRIYAEHMLEDVIALY